MGVSKTSENIQIKIKIPNPSQVPPVSSKAPNEDLKDLDVLWPLYLQNQKRDKIQNLDVSKTSNHIQIKIRIPNHSQEHPASSKAPNEDLKDMDVLRTFKIKIEPKSRSLVYQRKWPYQNKDQDAKPQSGTSSVLQSPKWGLKGHGCCLHLQNQHREPKFGSWVCQRPLTIFKSRSWCQTPVRTLQQLTKPKFRT